MLQNQVVPRIGCRVGRAGPTIGFEDARLDLRFTPNSSALIFRNEVDIEDAVVHTGIFRADFITDYDRDGLEGESDNCPEVANQSQLDSDDDKEGDTNDNDEVDNCPFNQNLDQADSNQDGIGDSCEELFFSIKNPTGMVVLICM